MSLTKEQLLQKRVVCTGHEDNHYPGSKFKPGQILYRYDFGEDENDVWYGPEMEDGDPVGEVVEANVINFPHLFRVLPWWERRTTDEMPDYVRNEVASDRVHKVVSWHENNRGVPVFSTGPSKFLCVEGFKPATFEEYESFINQLPIA